MVERLRKNDYGHIVRPFSSNGYGYGPNRPERLFPPGGTLNNSTTGRRGLPETLAIG